MSTQQNPTTLDALLGPPVPDYAAEHGISPVARHSGELASHTAMQALRLVALTNGASLDATALRFTNARAEELTEDAMLWLVEQIKAGHRVTPAGWLMRPVEAAPRRMLAAGAIVVDHTNPGPHVSAGEMLARHEVAALKADMAIVREAAARLLGDERIPETARTAIRLIRGIGDRAIKGGAR